jgi:hypothetical protein
MLRLYRDCGISAVCEHNFEEGCSQVTLFFRDNLFPPFYGKPRPVSAAFCFDREPVVAGMPVDESGDVRQAAQINCRIAGSLFFLQICFSDLLC